MRKALIIGIDNYTGSPLTGCVNDAVAITTLLETHADGSPNFSVVLKTAPSDIITRATLRESIELLFKGDPNVAFLYFSGHGIITSTGGYIVTQDFRKYDEGISMDDVLLLANNSKAKEKIIIFDCCYSGALGSPALNGNSTSQLSEGLTVLTACTKRETAIEHHGHGLFTSLLVDALQGGAADLLGNVTPGIIYSYIDQALGPWNQRPIFKTNVTRFTSLRKVVPPIATYLLRDICTLFPEPQYIFNLNPTYEYTEKTAIKENVAKFKILQKYERVGLVVPVDEEHMYYAALHSKSCRLTALGSLYWKLVKEKKV